LPIIGQKKNFRATIGTQLRCEKAKCGLQEEPVEAMPVSQKMSREIEWFSSEFVRQQIKIDEREFEVSRGKNSSHRHWRTFRNERRSSRKSEGEIEDGQRNKLAVGEIFEWIKYWRSCFGVLTKKNKDKGDAISNGR
jgi:hypothetical protein